MAPDASLNPDLIQSQSFTAGFRGYDQSEVRSFLNRVAAEVRSLRERAENLESAWRSAEERAARPPVLDEDTLMAAVGEETASILRSARAAAADMRSKAADEAEKVLTEARQQAAKAIEEAKDQAARDRKNAEEEAAGVVAAARTEAADLVDKARTEAADLVDKARAEAEAIRVKAEKERQLTIDGANSTRDRILGDLSRRRRVATVQIEQLRAGRERLIESYAVVRRTLEEAQAELSRADAEARAAADEVGRRLREDHGEEIPDEPYPPSGDAGGVPAPSEPVASSGGTTGPAPVVDLTAAEPGEEAVEPAAAPRENEEPVASAAGAPDEEASRAEGGHAVKVLARSYTKADEPEAAGEIDASGSGRGLEGLVGSKVDELFARIRATRSEAEGETTTRETDGAQAETAADPAEAGTDAHPAEAGGQGTASGVDTDHGEDTGHKDTSRDEVRSREETSRDEDTSPDEDPGREDTDRDERVLSEADESLLQQRESVVVDLEVTLTRRLKRALQDEQNDLLDRLRSLAGEPTLDRLLRAEDEQISRYSDAARSLLDEAAAAGAAFTRRLLGIAAEPAANGKSNGHGTGRSKAGAARHHGKDTTPAKLDELAHDAGTTIVSTLRRRLEQAIEVGGGEDQAVLIESVGAAYREWKTQRIERLAGDMLAAAFSRGTWEASPEGTLLRWIVEDTDGPCPDCDDDALAGELPKGEAFPTGQHHPPAHTGCRCLLVPAPAPG